MASRLSGSVISSSFVQLLKDKDPIVSTPSGITMPARFAQLAKALAPIDLTLPGIVTSVRLLHELNAPFEIVVTPFGMFISSINAPLNAHSPMLVIVSGSTIAVIDVQAKASFPIDVSPAGREMLVNASCSQNA